MKVQNVFLMVDARPIDSWIWKAILNTRDPLRKGICGHKQPIDAASMHKKRIILMNHGQLRIKKPELCEF